MADSKLSPRQKMINMMYLVLTAMLALNVSAEILQAFDSLRASLHETAGAHGDQNSVLAKDILNTIANQEKGDNKKYSHLKPIINDINTETAKTISYLDQLIQDLEVIGQKDPITGELVRKEETTKNYAWWLGNDQSNNGHGDGKAIELRNKLNEFVVWANKLYMQYDTANTPNYFKNLVIEPSEDPSILDKEAKAKTWEYFSFHEKPVIADLALIEKFKMDVRDIQSGLLQQMKSKILDFVFPIDSLMAFEAPSSEVVIAGMNYSTRLAVGMASSAVKPEFIGNGIKIDPSGSTALMTMAANGNVIPSGKNEGIQHYSAMIKVPKASGEFAMLPVKGQFIVRRPEVVVRSKALQILYKGCGNEVEVDVPALAENYNPDFSRSTGGKLIKSATSKKDITIVPTDRNFDLSVYSNSNGQSVEIGKLKYNVIKPPMPRIVLMNPSNNQEINGMAGLNKKQTVMIKLIPDGEFARTLPKDARYKAKAVKLMFQDSMEPPKTIHTYSGADLQNGIKIDLNQGTIKNARAGDKIYFEVEDVVRINFQGQSIPENIPMGGRLIPSMVRR